MKAEDGYFLAKRQMQELLEGRIEVMSSLAERHQQFGEKEKLQEDLHEIKVLEKTRDAIRNSLLWNKDWENK